MTNFEEIKKKIANMNTDELIEFCGGDTCENVLCSFVSDGDCCGNNCKVNYDCGGCIKKFLQRETRGVSPMRCPYCESGTNDFVPMNQTAEYSGIEMSVNRQGMLRVRVLDDDGGFTTQDIVEIRSCPLCGKRFVKGGLM